MIWYAMMIMWLIALTISYVFLMLGLPYLILLFTGWHWHTAPWRECMMIPDDIKSFCTTFTPIYTSPTQLKHVSTSFVSLWVMHSSIIFSYPSWPNLTQNDLWSHYVTFVIKHVFTYFLYETPYQHMHERFKTIYTFYLPIQVVLQLQTCTKDHLEPKWTFDFLEGPKFVTTSFP
jgi:hypothetical protein